MEISIRRIKTTPDHAEAEAQAFADGLRAVGVDVRFHRALFRNGEMIVAIHYLRRRDSIRAARSNQNAHHQSLFAA